ncbi:uncharacterized protein LOC143373832 isoform X2 [Andrena cerasifolii]|uniref:uncharacterized protein LOC143373832 isoform X2 n=1 Tax=Andrena cerasifolii TaxID=2819439 RepID=UPI004037A608
MGRISVAMLVGAFLCSCSGQGILGMDWLSGLTESIGTLNRNIQHNVQQLNQQIQHTVQSNLAQVHRMTENLPKDIGTGNVQLSGVGNLVLQDNDGTTIVQSGRTSDGKTFVRKTTDRIVGDTLRHLERIYDPATNTSKMHGYTLNLKDPNAKPVPINGDV